MFQSNILASLTIVVLLSVGLCDSVADDNPGENLGKSLAGTWERTAGPGFRAVKIVNQTHFMFTVYETKSRQPAIVGGGSYQFEGKKYIETLEFGSPPPGPLALVGKPQEFTATVNGDTWIHEGTLSSGAAIKEVWKRVTKPQPNPGNVASSMHTLGQLK